MTLSSLVRRLAQQPTPVLHHAGMDYNSAHLYELADEVELAGDRSKFLACASTPPLNALITSLAAALRGQIFFPFDQRLPSIQLEALRSSASLVPTGQKPSWLIATSGTSNAPRLVALSEHQILASIQASQHRLGLGVEDCWLCCLPLHHVGGLMIPWRCWHAGARMVLMERFDAAELMMLLSAQQVTHVSLVPSQLAKIRALDEQASPPPHLRVLLLGGAGVDESLAHWALDNGWPLCPTYGMSETASQTATQYPPPKIWQPGLAGSPLDHMQVRINDGHIQVRGDSIMLGYVQADGHYHLPLTADGWFDTGDLGQIQDGCLYVLGRADEVIISGGENIHPALIERELARMPNIGEVLITTKPDAVWGQAIHLLYTGNASADEVSSWCRDNLPGHYRPKSYEHLEGFELNSAGKLKRS